MQAFADIPNKLAYERLEMQRFHRRHGLSKPSASTRTSRSTR
jgi:hypothetical protein